MLVKCKCHGVKVDREIAYKVTVKGKNEYYCNEQEYKHIQQEKKNRINLLVKINDIFGYTVTNTLLNKELSELAKIYTYTKIYQYVKDNMSNLSKFMNKDFNNEFSKIKYFTAILKNNLGNYEPKEEEVIREMNIEIIKMKYKPKPRKKCLNEYLNELE